MIIGVPKEIKVEEHRVGLVPSGVQELTQAGHKVLVEHAAGAGVGFSDPDYINAGATVVPSANEVFAQADMVVKVKEPQPHECAKLRSGQILFTYLHLAAAKNITDGLLQSGCTAIAYETIEDAQGRLPLLAPMSEVAGRMAIQAGAFCLQRTSQGKGVLLAGVPGVPRAKVLVIGGGVVGENAAQIALGMGAGVTIVDKSLARLKQLDARFNGQVQTLYSTQQGIADAVAESDLVVGAVLLPGAAAPKLVTETMVMSMEPGSAIVDVAIDQGGCIATSMATTHQDPTYIKHGVVHYCVANMPGAVAKTATLALTQATLPYVLKLANEGWQTCLATSPGMASGLNVHQGQVYCDGVAQSFGLPLADRNALLGI
ncbi:MAG: alanine dehydrogenase [Pontibacterium sp.]